MTCSHGSSARGSGAPRTPRIPRRVPSTTTSAERRGRGVADRLADGDLLGGLLPAVSRSFALSLRILPASLARPLGVTYLVARAADTIADTRVLPASARQVALAQLRSALAGGPAPPLDPEIAQDHPPAERALLRRLPEVLAAHHGLDPPDHEAACRVLVILTGAMAEALVRFPSGTAGELAALESLAELDRYTYENAGCVGEFWTDMVMAHRPRCAGWDGAAMRVLGAAYGQGLQLLNVLRDLPRDLQLGRCYLPRSELARLGLRPRDLLDPAATARVRPLLDVLANRARAGLEAGVRYARAVPRREPRLRLASLWPALIGLATLDRLRAVGRWLDPAVTVKLPRPALRRLLARSAVLAWSDRGLTRLTRPLSVT